MVPMLEHWMLYLHRSYTALPWPWAGRAWAALTAADIAELPQATADFTRYAPTDGCGSQVPAGQPREWPHCDTRLAVYHDPEALYVFIAAHPPAQPIPELAAETREDFSLVCQLDGLDRGLYFGMNERGEHTCYPIVWDAVAQPAADFAAWPWTHYPHRGWGPVPGALSEGRVISTTDALVASWRIPREMIATGLSGDRLRLSAGRRCYRTNELLSWGSPIVWQPRSADMGTVVLAAAPPPASRPTLHRIDLDYDPIEETGTLQVTWQNPWSELQSSATAAAEASRAEAQAYAEHLPRCSAILNGLEQTAAMAAVNSFELPLVDGWNHLEILTATGSPHLLSFQKFSGNRLLAHLPPAHGLPSLEEVGELFARWHAGHERNYRGGGIWGPPGQAVYCLEHNGVFHAEPYALASLYLEEPCEVYRQRVQEACERVLPEQDPEGWFPCYCCEVGMMQKPPRFEGGAFANGAVGEALVLGRRVLGHERYLSAARRAAEAYRWYPCEINQNYAAFALWHLAELYELDNDPRWLERAVYYAEHAAGRGIDPAGVQDGHNYYCGYGGITLKGLAKLLHILPVQHPFGPQLQDWVTRFCNQMLYRQQPNGTFAERNRRYLGYQSLAPAPGLFEAARVLPPDAANALTPAMLAMFEHVRDGLQNPPPADPDLAAGLVLALLARVLAARTHIRKRL